MHGARILFNDLILLRQRSGIGFYAEQLLDHLDPTLPVVRLSNLLIAAPLRAAFSAAEFTGTAGPTRARARLLAWVKKEGHRVLDAYIAEAMRFSGTWDLYHEPDTLPLSVHAPIITTVHDLSVTLYPEWHPPHRVKKFAQFLEKAISRTNLYIAVSKKTKADMVEHWGIDATKIHVVPEAPRPQFKVMAGDVARPLIAGFHLPERYLLYCGTIEPRKNVAGLLRAYARLPAAIRDSVGLVLAGGWGWNVDEVRALLADAGPLVRYLGYVPDSQMEPLVSNAEALVYPSFYEGFGLPPLEAMACGVPVISSNAGSLGEILGQAACKIDPFDVQDISEAIEKVCTDKEYCRDLVKRGMRRAKHFTWEKTAEATSNVYRDFLKENS